MEVTQQSIDLNTQFSGHDDVSFSLSKDILIPKGFQLKSSNGLITFEELIGKGGFGKVYKIKVFEKQLALKTIESEQQTEISILMTYCLPHEISLFYSGRNVKEPPIIKFLGSGYFFYLEHTFSYYVLPIYTEDFRQFNKRKIESCESIIESTFTVVERIFLALEYLNEKNLVHNDIKEENIFLKMNNKPCSAVLGDFGSAIFGPDLEKINIRGTPNFMSNDSHRGKSTYRGDLLTTIFVIYNIFMTLPWSKVTNLENILKQKEMFLLDITLILSPLTNHKFYNIFQILLTEYQNLQILEKPDYCTILKKIKSVFKSKDDQYLATIMETLNLNEKEEKLKCNIRFENVGKDFMKLLSYTTRKDVDMFLTLVTLKHTNGFAYTYSFASGDSKCGCKKLAHYYKEHECLFLGMVSFSRYIFKKNKIMVGLTN
uniref:non-specific serine/threonine protein kinase n=1 Tax=Strongyloides papillosus TaxID=174720 RepID=A0A0N5BQ21_STREA